MAKKALLAVDIQNDFCPGGALPVPDGDVVVEPANRLISFAEDNGWLVLASRDWHPRNTSHFEQWPVHCVQDTKGAEFHPALRIDGARIISKGMKPDEDAYSPFDGFTEEGEPLESVLRREGVSELYVFGLATDYCVKAAVLDATHKGFKTFLVVDACRAVNVNPGDGEKAIAEMQSAGATIITAEEVAQ